MLKKHNIKIEGKKCVVLGDGGASKAVVAVLKKMGAKEVIIVDIIKTDSAITYDECFAKHTDAEFIANTSPVGMFPKCDASPVDLTKFPKCEAVADVIYNPLETKLVAQAKELGMTGVNGLEMLVAQALYAVEFFLEKKFLLLYRHNKTRQQCLLTLLSGFLYFINICYRLYLSYFAYPFG